MQAKGAVRRRALNPPESWRGARQGQPIGRLGQRAARRNRLKRECIPNKFTGETTPRGENHGFPPLRSAGGVLRTGHACVPRLRRAWLLGSSLPFVRATSGGRPGAARAPRTRPRRCWHRGISARRAGSCAPAIWSTSARGRTADGGRLAGAEPAVRMALLMVGAGAPGSVSVRLVQDFGRSDEPDAVAPTATALPAAVTAAPPSLKRSRGRPPGSRTRKNGALTTISVN